jgi:hypothetical protein
VRFVESENDGLSEGAGVGEAEAAGEGEAAALFCARIRAVAKTKARPTTTAKMDKPRRARSTRRLSWDLRLHGNTLDALLEQFCIEVQNQTALEL